jgi:hypothetical protein
LVELPLLEVLLLGTDWPWRRLDAARAIPGTAPACRRGICAAVVPPGCAAGVGFVLVLGAPSGREGFEGPEGAADILLALPRCSRALFRRLAPIKSRADLPAGSRGYS